MWFDTAKLKMPAEGEALPGRRETMPVPSRHHVKGAPLVGPFPGMETAIFGMGCFWGAERKFWQAPGVVHHGGRIRRRADAEPDVQGGLQRPHRAYRGRAGRVRPRRSTSYEALLKIFWENHDPTQGMRQGNDVGTQYRSAIYWTTPEQQRLAEASRDAYRQALRASGHGEITTEIAPAPEFYYAEDYHQQYLAKNPGGYCGIGGTGVSCPVGLTASVTE